MDRFGLLMDWSYIVHFMIDGRTRCRIYITYLMINPLRTVAAYMRHGKNNITICKQITVTPSLFNL